MSRNARDDAVQTSDSNEAPRARTKSLFSTRRRRHQGALSAGDRPHARRDHLRHMDRDSELEPHWRLRRRDEQAPDTRVLLFRDRALRHRVPRNDGGYASTDSQADATMRTSRPPSSKGNTFGTRRTASTVTPSWVRERTSPPTSPRSRSSGERRTSRPSSKTRRSSTPRNGIAG